MAYWYTDKKAFMEVCPMWTNSLLKNNARNALRFKRGSVILACLLAGVIGNLGKSAFARLTDSTSSLLTAAIPSFIISLLLSAVLENILNVGLCRYMMENRLGTPPLATIFSGYRTNFTNLAVVQFLVNLKISLGYILIIPGIYWQFKYAMVPYLLAEDPHLTFTRATELSGEMMEGEKFRFFLLQLSFIGWWLVSLLTLGLGYIFFLAPYIAATNAEFYAAMRAKAFSLGLADQSELGGFYTY